MSNNAATLSAGTVEMLAEVLWNLEGAPTVSDAEYEARFTLDARQQGDAAARGEIDAWWTAVD